MKTFQFNEVEQKKETGFSVLAFIGCAVLVTLILSVCVIAGL